MALFRSTAAAALLLVVAACGDNGLGPAKPADPLQTAANVQALGTTFTSSAFQSFQFASTWSPAATSQLAPLRTLLRTAAPALAGRPLSAAQSRLAATALRAALVPATGAGGISAAVLPSDLLGTTFYWNPTSSQYEGTKDGTAPANGVRFILYALVSGSPDTSQAIGYADLLDESTSTTQKLQLLVVGYDPAITYLDYTVSGTATTTTASISVVGFIQDGTHRLDFNVALSASSSSVTVDIKFDVTADNAHAHLKFVLTTLSSTSLKISVSLSLQFGSETVTLNGSETITDTDDSGSYTVGVNGGIYATVTITHGTASYTGGGGQQLTADDLAALDAISGAASSLLANVDALFAPAAAVI